MSSPYTAAAVPKQPNACDSGCGSDSGGNKPDFIIWSGPGDSNCSWHCPKTPPSGGCGGGSGGGGFCTTQNIDTMPYANDPLVKLPMPSCTDYPCVAPACDPE